MAVTVRVTVTVTNSYTVTYVGVLMDHSYSYAGTY
jgi:hypothetical protein